jgi:phospholipid/cholesterol/gamma-HCH transport system ATP-binding protein
MAKKPVIKIRGLVNAFGTQVVHSGLDFDVYPGEIIGVVGGSGTGKSVLLKTIIGLNTPQAGEIEVLGENMRKLSLEAQGDFGRRWGVLFQDGALFSSLNVGENIQVPLKEKLDLDPDIRKEIIFLKLSMVGLLPEVYYKFPSELSGGMRKRVGLARSLVLDPELLFLDEPTAGLDPIGAASFDNLVRDLKDTLGLTIFLVTHDLDTLNTVCDRIAVLHSGKIIVAGPLEDVKQFDHPWVQDYFNGPRGRAAQNTFDRR